MIIVFKGNHNETNLHTIAPFRRPLSAECEALLHDIISRLKSYTKYHGYDVKVAHK
jgi:hypothetical protein